jgi:hypothetical protein
MSSRAIPLITALVVIGVGTAGTIVAAAHREPDDAFRLAQRTLEPVRAAQLEALVASAPNPLPDRDTTRSVGASCHPSGRGELRNPWSCRVQYASGDVVRYRITIKNDRSWRGANRTGELIVYGCCVGRRE